MLMSLGSLVTLANQTAQFSGRCEQMRAQTGRKAKAKAKAKAKEQVPNAKISEGPLPVSTNSQATL